MASVHAAGSSVAAANGVPTPPIPGPVSNLHFPSEAGKTFNNTLDFKVHFGLDKKRVSCMPLISDRSRA